MTLQEIIQKIKTHAESLSIDLDDKAIGDQEAKDLGVAIKS